VAKYTKSYQPKDPETGQPFGPPQVFEGETLEELTDKLAAAHENASVRLYEIKKAGGVAAVLDYDPEQPLRQLKSRPLTADEKIKIAALRKDPSTAEDALRIEMEALLGTSVEEVQKMFNQIEIDRRTAFYETEASTWLSGHPEFVSSEANRSEMWKWVSKKGIPPTRKNLEAAFKALVAEDKLVLRAATAPALPAVAEVIPPAVTVAPTDPPAVASVDPATVTVPPTDPAIPAQATPASDITETPEQVRARTSSSGLGRDNSSVPSTLPNTPRVKEITFAQINAMNSVEYAKFIADPANKAAVEKLYAGTTTRTRA
jgi:hypothetical protein